VRRFQAFFRQIDRPMRLMSALLREGRAPADVIAAAYAGEDANRARNDSCTCGGARKWKRGRGTDIATDGI
jgi:uncharacterized protein